MKCKKCKENSLSSSIKITKDSSYSSEIDYFYDKNGDYHQHDKNTYRYKYQCENGHAWLQSEIKSCWCGWGSDIATSVQRKIS